MDLTRVHKLSLGLRTTLWGKTTKTLSGQWSEAKKVNLNRLLVLPVFLLAASLQSSTFSLCCLSAWCLGSFRLVFVYWAARRSDKLANNLIVCWLLILCLLLRLCALAVLCISGELVFGIILGCCWRLHYGSHIYVHFEIRFIVLY